MVSVEFHFTRVLRARAKLDKQRGKQFMSQTCIVRYSALSNVS